MTEQTVSSSAGSDLWKMRTPEEIIAYFPGDVSKSHLSVSVDLSIVYAPLEQFSSPASYGTREQEQARWDEAAGEAIWRLDTR